MFYIETGSTDPCYNLAFEEYILKNKLTGDWLMLWQNANTVVVGLNQNTAEEIDPQFIKQHGVTVVRRITGGGAVYHDLGNLNYSFITDANDAERLSMERFTSPVCAALAEIGVHAAANGRNDITVEGKKISGTAQRICGNRILHHGTLLFDTDHDMVAGALRVNPEKFNSKSTKSVRSRIGNIRDFLPLAMSIHTFKEKLLYALTREGLACATLYRDELNSICTLADEKYRTWDWTYGASPPFGMVMTAHYAGGSLSIRLDVKEGRIAGIRFFGDFMARSSLRELETAMSGCRFEHEEVFDRLKRFSIPDLFGSITIDEVMRTMFQ